MDIQQQTLDIFPAGTFAPLDNTNTRWKLFFSQSKFETFLLLRNPEQLLLTIIIPLSLLIILSVMHIGNFSIDRVNIYLPACLSLSVMSTGFTGQAIAVSFDRRYGVLKWLGTTALPRWNIIAAKCAAVAITVLLQCVLLWITAMFLAWKVDLSELFLSIVFVSLGAVTFTALGFLLGGTLKSEIVLGLANLLWFVFAMLGSCIIYHKFSPPIDFIISCTPPGALITGLLAVSYQDCDVLHLAILIVWALVTGLITKKKFRYS